VTRSGQAARRAWSLILVAIAATTLAACGGGSGGTAITTPQPVAPGTTTEIEEGSQVELRLRVGGTVLRATMLDSETTRDFISLLPLTLTLSDYAQTEKGQRSAETAVDRRRAGRRRSRRRRYRVLRAVGELRDLLQGLRLLERAREARQHRLPRRRTRNHEWRLHCRHRASGLTVRLISARDPR
jgi:hypothetical protein